MKNIIELRNISRHFSSHDQMLTVLNAVNLNIMAGEMVAIIGASGSGKSTLLNIMGCLDEADSGEYYLHGHTVSRLSPDELAKIRREHIGFIFQRYHLMPDLSALDNVELPAIYSSIRRDQRRTMARALLYKLGLQGREYHKPGELSGGQQQRVSIARALINGGEIILADEPTGALDSRSGEEVLAILSELNQRGHTVVIVTHDMKVAQHCQRIIELRDGEIIADSGTGITSTPPLELPVRIVQSRWRKMLDQTQESLRMAVKSMNCHRLRTALTMTGIIFGIAAVVSVMATGEGEKQKALNEIRELGTNVVSIYPGTDFFSEHMESGADLVPADADILMKQEYVDSLSPKIFIEENIRFLDQSTTASVSGIGRDYFRVKGIKILQGTTFRDDRSALQEAVIDENARKTFFDKRGLKPIGQIIFIGSVPVKVVGVAQRKGLFSPPNKITVWMPYSTVINRMTGKPVFNSINIRLKDNVANEAAVSAINSLLTHRHGKRDFQLFNSEEYKKAAQRTATILSFLNLMVASISLLTGSIGVMNIMLISVTERTHEIGVRMATGACRHDIMLQFMTEALLVCLAGGVLGIALSYAADPIIALLAGDIYRAVYSWQGAASAFLCSTLIGMIFGYLPARKAARMDPVTSLASE